MSLRAKRYLIGVLGLMFLASLLLVQGLEVQRRKVELGVVPATVVIPAASRTCVECHGKSSPAIVDHWKGSTHAERASVASTATACGARGRRRLRALRSTSPRW
ncbi:MAG: hypothetical protein U0835_10030 [Isosphaeraceae bacterium]